MYPSPPVPNFTLQMSTKTLDDIESYIGDDDYDAIASDNTRALESHGWHEGEACYLYVHPDGTLGHCSPANDIPLILIGSGLSLLLLFHFLNTIHRIYRCK